MGSRSSARVLAIEDDSDLRTILRHLALQSLSPGLTVVPAGDDLRITESAPPPLAAARNRLHVGPG